MGENNCWEREVVITELTKGKELMLQLQKHFDPMKQDVCQYLAREILCSYEKALSLLNDTTLSVLIISKGKQSINLAPSSSAAQMEYPHLLTDSSTKSCDRPSTSRKRKMVSRRTEYVHARSGEEVPPEDGYSWRKYGQKYILGAKYPREYYRCARRCLSNCAATKMVQRSETGLSIFEVTYEKVTVVVKKTKTKMKNYFLCKQNVMMKLEEQQGKYLNPIFLRWFQPQIIHSTIPQPGL